MKQKLKKMAKERRGVTLIALVITIIVLLILAGVTIAMLTGDNGIISKAMQAKNKTEEARKTEEAGLKEIEDYINGKSEEAGVVVQDFAVISLSDLLTPWEKIEKRLECASAADFAICLYNPSSKKRHDYLMRACDIMLKHKNGDTVCAVAKNIGRDGEEYAIMSLAELRNYSADMFTTVFIGNSMTKNIGGKMVTPRGYRNV